MERQHLDRIRFVTRHFHDLQGLRYLVPAGLMALSGGLALSRGWPWPLLAAALFLAGSLLLLGAKRYYGSTYGEVERAARIQPAAAPAAVSILGEAGPLRIPEATPLLPRVLLVPWLALSVFTVFQILFWPPWVDSHRAFLSRSIEALCGSLFLGLWWWRGGRPVQGYVLGCGLLLSGLAVLGPRLAPAAVDLRAALLLCGASLFGVGCLDHWQLVRVLGRPAKASGEEE
jgi:hypothetical protein